MVRIPPGAFLVPIPNRSVALGEFWLDTREVTNREYKLSSTVEDMRTASTETAFRRKRQDALLEEAMARFRDTTGRPGPSTWEMSAFRKERGFSRFRRELV